METVWKTGELPHKDGVQVVAVVSFDEGHQHYRYIPTIIDCYEDGEYICPEFPEKDVLEMTIHCWMQIPEYPDYVTDGICAMFGETEVLK